MNRLVCITHLSVQFLLDDNLNNNFNIISISEIFQFQKRCKNKWVSETY